MKKTLVQKLEEMKKVSNGLEIAVIDSILDHENDEDIKNYIHDVLNSGCISGVVGELIYYHETENFFLEYECDILEKIKMHLESGTIDMNHIFKNMNCITNSLAWLGYELTLDEIAQSVGIE